MRGVAETVVVVIAVLAVAALVARRSVRAARRRDRLADRAARRAEELAESEERFRLFVDGVRDAAIYMLDAEGRVRSWNTGAARIKGYPPDEITGRHFSVFYTAEDVAAGLPDRELADAAASGEVQNEGWRVRKGGDRFWAAVTVRALRGADGRVVGYTKLVRDTTERKRGEMRRIAQYEVARVLSEAKSASEALPSVLAGVGVALGYEAGLAWVPDDARLRVAAAWHRPGSRADSFLALQREATLRRGEGVAGQVWSSGAASWVEDVRDHLGRERAPAAAEAGLLSILTFPAPPDAKAATVVQLFCGDPRPRDAELLHLCATLGVQIGAYLEKQRVEEEAQHAVRRRAEELERRVEERTVELTALNRELEAFSYSVSHDLRAPLRAMDGFSQVLLEEYAGRLDAEGRDYLARIRAASQRMSHLIDDLLQLSRVTRSELRREPVDLSALFREVVAEVREREPPRDVEVVVQEGLQARGDPRLLRAGLVNVVSNAFKFTRGRESARVEFAQEGDGERRSYVVRDNGAGFDMTYASRLFQPFQRLHTAAEFEGTGIGLATWQRIVRRHGGRVWAEGEPGKGAAFHFTLGEY